MNDLKLASKSTKYAKPRDLDRLFISINAMRTMWLKQHVEQEKQDSARGTPQRRAMRTAIMCEFERDERKALSRVEVLP